MSVFKEGVAFATECRSCLNTVSVEELRGRLCTNCIQTAGKFLRDADKELLKNLTEGSRATYRL